MAQHIINPTQKEVAYREILRSFHTNPLAEQTHYTTLFDACKMLLDEEDIARLDYAVFCIEQWLSDDLNKIALDEAELYMFQNLDLYSGFQVNGIIITQQIIIKRLSDIKRWLYQTIQFDYFPRVRLTQSLPLEG